MDGYDIPQGTTIESLLESVAPALHDGLVPDGVPSDSFVVSVHVAGTGAFTVHIRGRAMRVERGENGRPTLWLFTTSRVVERFLEDARGPRRFLPTSPPPHGAVAVLSDPRLLKRVAMASGRMELALRDADGERLSVVLGFGDATRRSVDPDDPDVVVEATMSTIERMLSGVLPPEDALADGEVNVRGNRLLALQLALAVAPFYPAKGPR